MKRIVMLMLLGLVIATPSFGKEKDRTIQSGVIRSRIRDFGSDHPTAVVTESCNTLGSSVKCSGDSYVDDHIRVEYYVFTDDGKWYSLWDFTPGGLKEGDKIQFWGEKKRGLVTLWFFHVTNFTKSNGKEIVLGCHELKKEPVTGFTKEGRQPEGEAIPVASKEARQ
jgi:hypothetical protein